MKEWRGQCTGEFGKGGARVGTVDVRLFPPVLVPSPHVVDPKLTCVLSQWNAAGTMLSTTDDEGIIRIYKRASPLTTPLDSPPKKRKEKKLTM